MSRKISLVYRVCKKDIYIYIYIYILFGGLYTDVIIFSNFPLYRRWIILFISYKGYYIGNIYIYIYIYIYPFYRAIYRSDNLLQTYPIREVLYYIYFLRRGLYRCIEPSIFMNKSKMARRAKSYIFHEIYMIWPAWVGGGGNCLKDIYYIYGVSSVNLQLYSRLNLGFGSSSAFGLGRTKSSVSGLYSCI